MQAILLAAGYGSRLRPLTETQPKSLTEVNGVPLMVNALSLLAQNGISETIIVTGHMRDKIVSKIGYEWEGMKITYVENPDYRKTNNVYSLYLTKNYIKEDALLLECDLFYQNRLIKTILSGTGECSILVSDYNETTMDGTVIRTDGKNRAKALIIKKQQGEDFCYDGMKKTVNVYRFSKAFLEEKFFPELEWYIRSQGVNSYYELVLGALIYFGNDEIRTISIAESEWAEIDDLEDLKRAEEKFRKYGMSSIDSGDRT